MMHNGTSNFGEEDLASRFEECHHTDRQVRYQAWYDVGKVCCSWELG
jgi:hypothetical protein